MFSYICANFLSFTFYNTNLISLDVIHYPPFYIIGQRDDVPWTIGIDRHVRHGGM